MGRQSRKLTPRSFTFVGDKSLSKTLSLSLPKEHAYIGAEGLQPSPLRGKWIVWRRGTVPAALIATPRGIPARAQEGNAVQPALAASTASASDLPRRKLCTQIRMRPPLRVSSRSERDCQSDLSEASDPLLLHGVTGGKKESLRSLSLTVLSPRRPVHPTALLARMTHIAGNCAQPLLLRG